ncbi:MAG: hypothetical protein HQL56_07235 [Magnetococcales bacterium]|nr:hypothetical protein [Magnetococcales bacterium]
MRILNRLWSALETVPGLSAIPVEWQQLLGEDHEIGMLLLRPTDRRAASYPCPSPGGMGCPRQVIDQGRDGLIAVCSDEDGPNCDDVSLQLGDIVVYELHRQGLAIRAASALGIKPEFAAVDSVRETFRVGDFHPIAGKRFPVYLILAFDDRQRLEAVVHLCRITSVPFILLAPTPRSISPRALELLQERQASFHPLSDLLIADDQGQMTSSPVAREVMTAFRAVVLPEAAPREPTVRFPTPPDARWGDLRICFLDGHRATLTCKGVSETVNFSTMGMENKLNREPSVQWTLLHAFALNHGKISWCSSEATKQVPQQVKRLNEDLERFFGIAGRSVTWKRDEKVYSAAFEILQESDKPAQAPPGMRRPSR